MKVKRRKLLGALIPAAALLATLTHPVPVAAKARPTTVKASLKRSPVTLLGSTNDALIKAVVRDLDTYWRTVLPQAFGVAYKPLAGYFAADEQHLPPNCGRSAITYDEILDNAFYCRTGDYIAWDDRGLFAELESVYGEAALAMVLAHESGHAVQARANVRLPDVYVELQADCLAGGWFRHVANDASTTLKFDADALDDAIGAILAFRDDPGTSATSANAHGSGFDRITSFQLGYELGPKRCARYRIDRPPITATTFRADEAANGGDVPLEEAIDVAVATANEHFKAKAGIPEATVEMVDSTEQFRAALVRCGDGVQVARPIVAACPSNNSIIVDRTRLGQIYGSVRDAGIGYVLALGWAGLTERLIHPEVTGSRPFTLAISCLAGSWLESVSRGTNASLSPGDLDEAVAAVIGLPPTSVSGPVAEVSAFDRVIAVRLGFSGGVAACA